MTSLVVGFCLYRIGRFMKGRYDGMKQMIKIKEKEIELLTDLWKIDESEIDWLERINQGRVVFLCDMPLFVVLTIAIGGYGEVWRCEWREHAVAVKKLLNHWISPDSNIQFEKEIQFLQTIRHPNIVLFYGAGELKVSTYRHNLQYRNEVRNLFGNRRIGRRS